MEPLLFLSRLAGLRMTRRGLGMSLKITVYDYDLTPWPPLLKGEGEY